MGAALAISDIATRVVSSTFRLVNGTAEPAVIAAGLATMVRETSQDENLRLRLSPLTTVLPPSYDSESAPANHVERDVLGWGLYGTLMCFADPTLKDLENVQSFIESASLRLRAMLKESTPPPALSGIFGKVAERELSTLAVERQMADALTRVLLGTLHDANNFLAPIVAGLIDVKEEAQALIALVDENVHYLPEEVRPLVPQYAGAIDKNVHEIDALVSQTADLTRRVMSMMHLSLKLSVGAVDIPGLFREGGFMRRIAETLDTVEARLILGHRELGGLFTLSKSHGHILPQQVYDDGMKLLNALEACFNDFHNLVTLITELLRLLSDIVAGIDQSPCAISLDGRMTLLQPRMMAAVVGKWVKVGLDLEADPWPVWGFPIHVSQILLNIACNARDAMNSNGFLDIATRKVMLRPEDLAELERMFVRGQPRAGGYMRLRIQDSGPGIPDDFLPRIFDLGKSGKGSSGVGLAVVLKLIEDMGGFVTVETATQASDQLPQGTTFTVYLPQAEAVDKTTTY